MKQEILRLAEIAARRAARKCWWADESDLRNEAIKEMLVSERGRKFNPSVRVAEEAYYWQVCVFAIKRYLWANSTPVSGGSHRPEESYAGIKRASIATDARDEEDRHGVVLEDEMPSLEERIDEARWRASVRKRVTKLARGNKLAAEVVFGEREAPSESIAQTARQARRFAGQDRELFDLMRERG